MRSVLICLAPLVLASLAAPAPVQGGGWHQDARFGFKFQPPKGWTQIPLKVDENWLVAKYLSDKTYVWNDKEIGWSTEHKPELMVIAFVEEAIKKAGEKKDVTTGTEEKEDVIVVTNPYKNYEDFLDRTYSGGGFYVSSREEAVENDVPVTKYEIKVEKLVRDGPKRLVTWIYHAPDVDFAVQTEVLENQYDKLKSTVTSSLRSFKLVPRTQGSLPTDATVDSGVFISIHKMKEGSPEERRSTRMESERRLHEAAITGLLEGWKHRFTKRCLLLYDADPKYVDRVAEHCDKIFEWLDANLGFIGPEEYVRKPIVRICANENEMGSFSRGVRDSSSWSWNTGNEIVTCKPDDGFLGYEMDGVNREIFDLWLRDRNDALQLGLPSWIRHGLSDYISGARLVKADLQFRDYVHELIEFKIAVAQGKNMPVRDLVQMTGSQFFGPMSEDSSSFWNRLAQADMFLRFLLSSEASHNKLTKELLGNYVQNLLAVIAEVEGENIQEKSTAQAAPKTEEEEEEQYKKRHQEWESPEREKQTVQRTFSRTFGGWEDKDWAAVEKAFLKFVD
jgi:hypothetical protein